MSPSSPRRRDGAAGAARTVLAVVVAAVLVVGAVAAGALVWRDRAAAQADRDARAAATGFAAAWQAGNPGSVAYANGSPAAVQQAYAALTKGLSGAKPAVSLAALRRTGDTATGTVRARWALPGGAVWSYDVPVRVLKGGSRWAVQATSPDAGRSLFAPVAATSTLRLQRVPAARGQVLGKDGAALVTERPVVDVGVQPSRVNGDPAALAAALAKLVDVEAAPLAARIKAAGKDAFVPVITLRRSDYAPLRAKLQALPGTVFRERTQALAPTRDFARALIGSVGPVTAEQVTAAGGRLAAGDVAGLSGLQRRYDERLSGTAGSTVSEVPASGGPARALFSTPAAPGKSLTLTLDPKVQQAADAALAGSSVEAALVAVDVRTGAVLAVANSPSSGLNRAMVGQYPPGSMFKVVSTLALLGTGLRPSDTVQCPPTATVEGRTFKNYESEQLGPVPFSTDFAKSCNTAFVGLSSRLADDDLRTTARALGIGASYDLGAAAYAGDVPVNTSAVDRAAATFGQGRTLVSPLAMTVATASVARGSYVPPTLVVDPAPKAAAGPAPLATGDVTTLRALMRQVVTDGTGEALKEVPGGPVSAKTGTAEFGSASPPATHAWITGWQGDIAFTVFVDTGKSGGSVAGPVAARFLTALAR